MASSVPGQPVVREWCVTQLLHHAIPSRRKIDLVGGAVTAGHDLSRRGRISARDDDARVPLVHRADAIDAAERNY